MSSQAGTVTAQIGGIPTVDVDVPICAVFLAIFVGLAAGHMTVLQINMRKGHKFLFNGMLFGYAMSRIMACIFRIVWATQPTNADVSLVAAVFLNAGVLIVYLVNIFLAWRMVRSTIPSFGWHPAVRIVNKAFLWLVLALILPLIVIIILRVKSPTLAHVQDASSVLSMVAQTYFLIVAVAPVALLLLAVLQPEVVDTFGSGPWRAKVVILTISIPLALIEAGFRCGTAWTVAPPATNPAWWDSKAAFYCFNFVVDVLILALFLVGRIDQRFHIPNKANGPMSYSEPRKDEAVGEKRSDGLEA